jgi:hypothetical protein
VVQQHKGAAVTTLTDLIDRDRLSYDTRLEQRLSKAFMYALLALVFLNVADVVTTRWLLSIGSRHGMAAVEADPLSKALLAGYRVEIVKIVLLSLAERVRVRLHVKLATVCVGWFVAGIYGMVVLNNTLILVKVLGH